MKPTVILSGGMGTEVYYTIDGSEPSRSASKYTGPFTIEKSGIIKAVAVGETATVNPPMDNSDMLNSAVNSMAVKIYEWKSALTIKKPASGIAYKYYEPAGAVDINSVKGNATASGVTDRFSNEKKKRTDRFAFEFNGYIKIDKDGIWSFFTDSDDGSKLYIDEEEVVDNDGNHGNVEKNGKAALKKGYHKIKVLYFDSGGGNALKVSFQTEGETKKEIPADMLYH